MDSVVAVVDGLALAEGRVAGIWRALAAQRGADPALDHDDPVEEVFGDQVACADLGGADQGGFARRGGAGGGAWRGSRGIWGGR